MRTMLRHLQAGRVVGIFPEGELRAETESVLRGGEMREGICKLAQLAGVPVVPCVVAGTAQFYHWKRWLPLARTRWTVAYGEAISPRVHLPKKAARAAMMAELQRALLELKAEVERTN